MTDDGQDENQHIQQELRLGRKFTVADAIGQEAGGFMAGVSPVPRLVQAKTQVLHLLNQCLKDSEGALQVVLHQWIEADDAGISRHLEAPETALRELLVRIIRSPETLYELVRQTDVTWGDMYDEYPHFQQPGQPPHPDAAYSHESVRAILAACLLQLATQTSTTEMDISPT
ncbi:MAG: hypothetical protein ACFCVD_15695 [Nodosilinea sp.]